MKKHLAYFLGAVTLLGACTQDSYLDTPPDTKAIVNLSETVLTKGSMPGVLHVKVQGEVLNEIKQISTTGVTLNTAPSLLSKTLHSVKATALKPLFNMDPRFEERFRKAGLDCWYEVRFDEKQDLQQTLSALNQSQQFSIVEPVFATSIPTTKAVTFSPDAGTLTSAAPSSAMPFNDPELNKQWHYQNFGTTPKSVKGADINLFQAWETETGKPNVIVAIVDGGIDVTHEDLMDNLWVNSGEIPGNGIDDDGNGYVDDVHGWNFCSNTGEITLDDAGHGTHVAGTVAARNNNGIGVGGIAGGDGSRESGIRLMSCQKFEGEYGASAEDAFRYSADNGAVISQNSWGYNYPGPSTLPSAMKAAIDYFIKYAGCDAQGRQLPNSPMKGGVVIFAAGNDDADYKSLPGAYAPTIAVSAMAPDWKKAWYTNRGDWVDIMAPGGDQYYSEGMVYSTVPPSLYRNQSYGYMQGTSMACPHVSGVAALIVSHFGGQGFTNKDLETRLMSALRPENIDEHNPGYEGRLGVGYIDASIAVGNSGGNEGGNEGGGGDEDQNVKPGNVTDLQIQAGYNSATLSWSAVADENDGTPKQYLIYCSTTRLTESNYKQVKPFSIDATGYATGEEVSCRITQLQWNTTYYVAVIAVDQWGLESDFSVSRFTT